MSHDTRPAQHDLFVSSTTMTQAGRAERWALWRVEGLGSARIQRLIKLSHGDLDRLWRDPRWAACASAKLGLSERCIASLKAQLDVPAEDHYARELDALAADERLVHRHDASYPRALLDLRDPPEFVYIRGDMALPAPVSPLALVGSRNIPAAHERMARTLSAELCELGVTIVSGGALGMDAAAHRGALDAGGVTCVVLPGGLHALSPGSHRGLFAEVVERGGALLSEYPLDCVPRRYHYARRNRLIASLSRGVLVLKAAATGGTLLTVEAAEELGRVVMALPYEANDSGARGSHALIRGGRAVMVCSAQEVVCHGLGQVHCEEVEAVSVVEEQDVEDELVWCKGERICSVDDLAKVWGLSVSRVMVRLFELELCGAVRKIPGAARYERLR